MAFKNMFGRKNKKEEKNDIVFSTSSVTRTENTITTSNHIVRQSATVIHTTYREQKTGVTGTSNIQARPMIDQKPFPKLRSAFEEPISTYGPSRPLSQPVRNMIPSKFDAKPLSNTFYSTPSKLDAKPFSTNLYSTQSKIEPKPIVSTITNPTNNGFQTSPSKPNLNLSNLTRNSPPRTSLTIKPFDNELNSALKVKVNTSKQFLGGDSKIPTYNTRSPRKRGKMLIINNVEFKGKKREGANVDQRNLVALFRQIGFDVSEYKNKRKTEMENIVKNFASSSDLKRYDICLTVIMSHGNIYGEQTMIETIDEQLLSTEWVVQQFNGTNCKGMNDKPKIFIFQCCRGENENANIQTDASMFQPPRLVQDILISYSTIPGFVAYRDPKLGSWYIQGLCKVFMEHACDTHIEDLLKIVDSELAKLNVGNQRQTSSYENRGFKICYLNPIG